MTISLYFIVFFLKYSKIKQLQVFFEITYVVGYVLYFFFLFFWSLSSFVNERKVLSSVFGFVQLRCIERIFFFYFYCASINIVAFKLNFLFGAIRKSNVWLGHVRHDISHKTSQRLMLLRIIRFWIILMLSVNNTIAK